MTLYTKPTFEQRALMLTGAFLANNDRILAIKTLRAAFDIGLKEAKDFVDSFYVELVSEKTDRLAESLQSYNCMYPHTRKNARFIPEVQS